MDDYDGIGMWIVELKDKSVWVSACRQLQVEGTKSKGRGRKMWNEFVKIDMEKLGLVKDDAHNRGKWRSFTSGNCSSLPQCHNKGVILYGLHSSDIKTLMIVNKE